MPAEATKQLPTPHNSQDSTLPEKSRDAQPSPGHAPSSPSDHDMETVLNGSDPPSASSPSGRSMQTPNTSQPLSTPPSSLQHTSQKLLADVTIATAHIPQNAQLTKKRSHEEMSGDDPNARVTHDSPKDAKSLRRSSSFVRLAVSADGSVKVRVNDEATPSPPKERPAPPAGMASRRSSGLMRAQSDVSSTFDFRDTAVHVKGPTGRSRDARTWEFYCDRSARLSLAARAEEEATGSAVGALGLMRSASQRRQALTPNAAKQNRLRRSQSALKAKPSLARTQSSMGRLQGSDGIYEDETPKKQPNHQRQNSGSDSDKENWLPGTRASIHGMRRSVPSAARSTILQRARASAAHHAHPAPGLQSANDQEDSPVVGSGKEKGDDLDCVQGLLSLSQGAWR